MTTVYQFDYTCPLRHSSTSPPHYRSTSTATLLRSCRLVAGCCAIACLVYRDMGELAAAADRWSDRDCRLPPATHRNRLAAYPSTGISKNFSRRKPLCCNALDRGVRYITHWVSWGVNWPKLLQNNDLRQPYLWGFSCRVEGTMMTANQNEKGTAMKTVKKILSVVLAILLDPFGGAMCE